MSATARERTVEFGAVVAVMALTRIPLWSELPYTWDSVQLAQGLESYEPALFRPHPPGYFLVVMSARLFAMAGATPLHSFSLLNFVACVAGTLLLIEAGALRGSRAAGRAAAALLLLGPVLWLYSSVPESHPTDAFFGAAVVCWASLGTRLGTVAGACAGGALLALWAGFRTSGAMLLAPYAAWMIVRAGATWKLGARNLVLSILAGFVVLAAWVVPWLGHYESLEEMRSISRIQFDWAFSQTSIFHGATPTQQARNAVLAALWLLCCLGVAGTLLFLFSLRRLKPARWELLWLLVPAAVFHAGIYIGRPAYWFPVIPGLLLMAALSLRDAEGLMPRVRLQLLAALLAVEVLRFLLPFAIMNRETGALPEGRVLQLASRYSAAELHSVRRRHELAVGRLRELIAETDPWCVAMLPGTPEGSDWRRLQWAMPEVKFIYVRKTERKDNRSELWIAQHGREVRVDSDNPEELREARRGLDRRGRRNFLAFYPHETWVYLADTKLDDYLGRYMICGSLQEGSFGLSGY